MNDADALTPEEQRLVKLTIAICRGDWQGLRQLRREAPPGEPNRAWREALLQSHLFAGFPRMVEACAVLAKEGGVGKAEGEECEDLPVDPNRGRKLWDRIYEDAGSEVSEALASAHPEVLAVTMEHAYGRILSRPGLAGATRELMALGALAEGKQGRQLASHARGAKRLGASPGAIAAAVRLGTAHLSPAEAKELMEIALRYGELSPEDEGPRAM